MACFGGRFRTDWRTARGDNGGLTPSFEWKSGVGFFSPPTIFTPARFIVSSRPLVGDNRVFFLSARCVLAQEGSAGNEVASIFFLLPRCLCVFFSLRRVFIFVVSSFFLFFYVLTRDIVSSFLRRRTLRLPFAFFTPASLRLATGQRKNGRNSA